MLVGRPLPRCSGCFGLLARLAAGLLGWRAAPLRCSSQRLAATSTPLEPTADLGSQVDALSAYASAALGSPRGSSGGGGSGGGGGFWGRQPAGHGAPPLGYMSIWMGRFKSWRKRYFVASTPGEAPRRGRLGC